MISSFAGLHLLHLTDPAANYTWNIFRYILATQWGLIINHWQGHNLNISQPPLMSGLIRITEWHTAYARLSVFNSIKHLLWVDNGKNWGEKNWKKDQLRPMCVGVPACECVCECVTKNKSVSSPSASKPDPVWCGCSFMELAEAPRVNLEINCSFKCNQCTFNVKKRRVYENGEGARSRLYTGSYSLSALKWFRWYSARTMNVNVSMQGSLMP